MGLRNLGNTCFMNAGLQCLSHLTPFVEYFLSEKYSEEINEANPRGQKGELARAFSDLQRAMWQDEDSSYDLKVLHDKLAGIAPHLFEGDQQDVQEFLAFCLDGLHEDLNRVKHHRRQARDEEAECERVAEEISEEMAAAVAWHRHLERDKSFIVDLLQGQLRSSVTCETCGHCSRRFDPFLYLSVPVTRQMTHLTDTLAKYQEEEMLTEDEQWMCVKCDKPVNAKKKIQVWKLPPVLVLHLKRYEADRSTGCFRKITALLTVPQEIDLGAFCHSKQRHGATYRLVCAANHSGKYGRGHYAATCCLGGGVQARQWIFVDDEEIKEISSEQAVGVASQHGYVLFFMKKELAEGTGSTADGSERLRRQTVSMPELWPHLVSKRNSVVSDVMPKLDKPNDDFGPLFTAVGDRLESPTDSTAASGSRDKARGRRTQHIEAKLANLRVGNRVMALGKYPGTIRFIGDTKFMSGEWVGVELDEPFGKNDGSVQGVSYFRCKPMTGIFVRRSPNQLRPMGITSPSSPSDDFGESADPGELKIASHGSEDSYTCDVVDASDRIEGFQPKLSRGKSEDGIEIAAASSVEERPSTGRTRDPREFSSAPTTPSTPDGEVSRKGSLAAAGMQFGQSKTVPVATTHRKSVTAEEMRKRLDANEEDETTGDNICVSSQAEMQEAIRECATQVKRLHDLVNRLSDKFPEAPEEAREEATTVPAVPTRQCCKYGERCYRTGNPLHTASFCHPGDSDWDAQKNHAETAVLEPEHKAILERLLLAASTRLGKRLAERIQEPLDRQVSAAFADEGLKQPAGAQTPPSARGSQSDTAVADKPLIRRSLSLPAGAQTGTSPTDSPADGRLSQIRLQVPQTPVAEDSSSSSSESEQAVSPTASKPISAPKPQAKRRGPPADHREPAVRPSRSTDGTTRRAVHMF